jgi:hypothetical protein
MRHRPGITLVEVLVAIFIMAIAMLALLALFPLGALSMAQALKDDRCATCAVNAEALAVAQDVRHDLIVAGNGTTYNDSFANPFGTVGTLTSQLSQAQGSYSGPGFGVLVDPFTYPLDTNATNNKNVGQVAGVSLGIPRRSLAFSVMYPAGRPPNSNTGALSTTEAARWCSMLDGITWVRGDNVGNNAVPDTSSTGGLNIIRDGRYQWAWLLRRPLWSSDAVIDMSVVIFSGRPANTAPPDGEVTCTVPLGGAGGSNSLTIDYTGKPKPSIRSGGWILDVTPVAITIPNAPPGGPTLQVVYGYPYRVVNATDSGANQVTLELQTPIYPAFYPVGSQNYGTGQTSYQMSLVTILENAVEVFDRGSFVQP